MTSLRLTRPVTGAVTRVHSRFSSEESAAARAAASDASACLRLETALS